MPLNLNSITLAGCISCDPILTPASGEKPAKLFFGLAVKRARKYKGEPVTDFWPVTLWGAQAEAGARYLKKGKQVAVQGELHRFDDPKLGNGAFKINISVSNIGYGDDPRPKTQQESPPKFVPTKQPLALDEDLPEVIDWTPDGDAIYAPPK